jgi:uncharacterized protein (TIGR00369 family)
VDFATPIPFAGLLGIELHRFAGGEAEMSLEMRDELTNSWGVAHGGVTMTLLDVVMAHAARSPDVDGAEPRRGVVTIEMKTSFLQPGSGRLVALGNVLHRSATMAFCQGSVRDGEGRLVGHGTGTFKYMNALPAGAGGRSIRRLDASD